jgi:hypothetical protein
MLAKKKKKTPRRRNPVRNWAGIKAQEFLSSDRQAPLISFLFIVPLGIRIRVSTKGGSPAVEQAMTRKNTGKLLVLAKNSSVSQIQNVVGI